MRRKLRKGTWEICHVCPFWSHRKWVHLICGHRVIGASHTWALRVIYSKCVYGMVMIIVIAWRCCGPSACPAQNLYGISTCRIQLPSPPLRLHQSQPALWPHEKPFVHFRSLRRTILWWMHWRKDGTCCKGWLGPPIVHSHRVVAG